MTATPSSLSEHNPTGAENDVNITAIRCAIDLDLFGKQAADYYLTRSRYFWNMLVTYAEDYFEAYLRDGVISEESDQKLHRCLTTLYELIAHKNLKKEGIVLDHHALMQIEMIRQLPNTTLRNRVEDLFKLYVGVKRRISEGNKVNIGKPKQKDAKSRQSIRFEPSDYLVDGNTITILGEPELKITLGCMKRFDFTSPKAITLNYSPRSTKLSNSLLKPKTVPFYYITVDDAVR